MELTFMVTNLLWRKQKDHLQYFTATKPLLRALICQKLYQISFFRKQLTQLNQTQTNHQYTMLEFRVLMQLSAIKKIDIVPLVDSTPREMKMKDADSQIEGRRSKKQLNHYVERTLDNINMIVPQIIWALMISLDAKIGRNQKRCQIVETCQKYKISKIIFFSILLSSRTKINMKSINEKLKALCFRNNFTFIDCYEITSNDLWVDGIRLKILGKARLTKFFVVEVNNYLIKRIFSF